MNDLAPSPSVSPAYLWFDTEFTDLDPDKAHLLQAALIVTDVHLERMTAPEKDLNLCVRLPAGESVSPWVEENLAGLLQRCRSKEAVSIENVDAALCRLVDEVVGSPAARIGDRPVLAGNTIHADLNLLRKFLPRFERRIHYRLLDVSSLKLQWQDWFRGPEFDKEQPELIRRYFPGATDLDGKPHDAYYDIQASAAELGYYRSMLGRQSDSQS